MPSCVVTSFRSQCSTIVDILYQSDCEDARYKVEALLDFLFDKMVFYESTNRKHSCLEYKLDLDHIRFFALLCKTISDIEIERTESILDLTDTRWRGIT